MELEEKKAGGAGRSPARSRARGGDIHAFALYIRARLVKSAVRLFALRATN